MDQVLDIRSDGANRWQTQQKNGNNHRNDSKMCKTKPMLSEAWAELSPPQRKERSRRSEEELGGGGSSRRDKNPHQGESLDKTKTKQTVQLRTSKIHKTRRQAGGLRWVIIGYKLVMSHEHELSLLSYWQNPRCSKMLRLLKGAREGDPVLVREAPWSGTGFPGPAIEIWIWSKLINVCQPR